MTTYTPPPTGGRPAAPESPRRGTAGAFAAAGIVAGCSTAAAVPLGLLDRILNGRGGVGVLTVIVLAVATWVVLFAVARYAGGFRERAGTAQVRDALGSDPAAPSVERLAGYLLRRLDAPQVANSLIARRLRALWQADGDDLGSATASLASRSELDHAHSDVSYGPARALVWALPALGFLGTAAEMSRAVAGLSETVGGTTNYGQLRDALVADVIPPLANAFGVTLFALGASVVCHLLLTWITVREQRILLEVEEAILDVLARVPGGAPATPAPAAGFAELNGEITQLSGEIARARLAMTRSADQVSAMDLGQLGHLSRLSELGPLLRAVDHRLELIHTELAGDLVVSRLRPASPPPAPPPTSPMSPGAGR